MTKILKHLLFSPGTKPRKVLKIKYRSFHKRFKNSEKLLICFEDRAVFNKGYRPGCRLDEFLFDFKFKIGKKDQVFEFEFASLVKSKNHQALSQGLEKTVLRVTVVLNRRSRHSTGIVQA